RAGDVLAANAPRREPFRHDAQPCRAAAVVPTGSDGGTQGDLGAVRAPLETYVDRDVVDGAGPGQPRTRLPDGDPAEFEPFAGRLVVHLDEPSTDARLASHADRAPRIEVVDWPAHPPLVELLGECREGRLGVHRDRDRDAGACR